ncbi:hypothetical protein ES706_03506 [subsurface metagenome]
MATGGNSLSGANTVSMAVHRPLVSITTHLLGTAVSNSVRCGEKVALIVANDDFCWVEFSRGVRRQIPPRMIRLEEIEGERSKTDNTNLYVSIYRYLTDDPNVGPVYGPFYLDLDDETNPDRARREAVAVAYELSTAYSIPAELVDIRFTGKKGFSIVIRPEVLGAEPSVLLPRIYRRMAERLAKTLNLKTIDFKVYERRRLWRLNNSIHPDTGRHKIFLTLDELKNLKIDQIRELALKPRSISYTHGKIEAIPAAKKFYADAKSEVEKKFEGRGKFTLMHYEVRGVPPCVEKRLEIGTKLGCREQYAFELAVYFAGRQTPIEETKQLLTEFARRCDPPLDAREVEHAIETAYQGVTEGRYSVGCSSDALVDLCPGKEKCPIFSQGVEGPDHSQYFDDGRFVPKWLAENIMKEYNFATMDGDVIYAYVNGVYVPSGAAIIKYEAQSRLGDRATTHYVDEVVGFIKRETYQPREKFNLKHLINLKNGFLNIKTGELLTHTPEKLSTIRIPVAYDPSANCPNIQKFLREVLHEGDMPTILELFGYCLYLGYPIHKAFMFVGDGANGKSTLINLLKTFLRRENCASVSLQELEINRFATNALDGKLANLYADLPSKALSSTARFKMLTGEDLIGAERKFGAHFTFENHAKLIFSTNRIPKAEDDTAAFFRRWIIINFPNVFEGKRAYKRILEKLTTDEELSGLLNLALKGLGDLLERGDFSSGKSTEEAREQYIRMSDSIGAFVMDRVEIAPEEWVSKRELYSVYCEYCRDNNYPTVSDGTFHKNIHQYAKLEDFRPLVDGKRLSAWRGIRLKSERHVNHVKDVNPFPYSLFTFDSGKENREEKKESKKEVEKTPDIPDMSDTKEPEIEPIVDTACSRCGARGKGLHWTRAGEPLCDKCAEDFPGDL